MKPSPAQLKALARAARATSAHAPYGLTGGGHAPRKTVEGLVRRGWATVDHYFVHHDGVDFNITSAGRAVSAEEAARQVAEEAAEQARLKAERAAWEVECQQRTETRRAAEEADLAARRRRHRVTEPVPYKPHAEVAHVTDLQDDVARNRVAEVVLRTLDDRAEPLPDRAVRAGFQLLADLLDVAAHDWLAVELARAGFPEAADLARALPKLAAPENAPALTAVLKQLEPEVRRLAADTHDEHLASRAESSIRNVTNALNCLTPNPRNLAEEPEWRLWVASKNAAECAAGLHHGDAARRLLVRRMTR